jgi:hypothetical protein
MAMYSAYFDDSGHPDAGRYLVVGGAVADVNQWVYLERDWKEALASFGLTEFHATDFEKRWPPFNALSDCQRESLLMRLAGIICLRAEKTISAAIDLEEFKRSNDKYVFAEMYGFPYPQCARSSISRVEGWAKKHSIVKEEIKYFFEDGTKHRGQLKWIADRDSLPEPEFIGKRYAQIQAADLLAWSHHQYLNLGGHVPAMYQRMLEKLSTLSSIWELIEMKDPDRLPVILGIPRRDPELVYKCKVYRTRGKRRAIVLFWPRTAVAELQLKKQALNIPDSPFSTPELIKRTQEYDAKRAIEKAAI